MSKILVVDDEVELCDVFAEMLTMKGYEVLTAYGGEEAFNIVLEQPSIDVVISDIKMPKGSGTELFHRLREANIKARFFYITGYSEFDRNQLISEGALEVFSKPLNYDAIFLEIEKVLKAL